MTIALAVIAVAAGVVAVLAERRRRAAAAEAAQLHDVVARAGGAELVNLEREVARLTDERARAAAELSGVRAELGTVRREVVQTRETALLQEVGLYDYRHPLEDSVAYKAALADLKVSIKAAVKTDQAVDAATDWTVNNSQAQGRKLVRDFSKLMLRAYNNEVDHLVRTMKPYKLDAAVSRLGKTRETIARLGKTMSIRVTDHYHGLRVRELELTADYRSKVAEEKERAKEERARLREERRAMQELKAEEARLEKERGHRAAVVVQLEASGAADDAVAEAKAELAAVEAALEGILQREANVRAGYVYVISNVGSFGPDVVKIGMTRRLEPMERVTELGDASVPFRFDVHALVFSEDAVGLEAQLHAALADRRVNLVNLRREYFYATPDEVRDLLAAHHGQLLTFESEPEAVEWHQSNTARRAPSGAPAGSPAA